MAGKGLTLWSHGVLSTSNVHFVVHKDATLILQSKEGIDLRRHESSSRALIMAAGTVVINWPARLVSLFDKAAINKDTFRIVRLVDNGKIWSQLQLRHSPTSIVSENTITDSPKYAYVWKMTRLPLQDVDVHEPIRSSSMPTSTTSTTSTPDDWDDDEEDVFGEDGESAVVDEATCSPAATTPTTNRDDTAVPFPPRNEVLEGHETEQLVCDDLKGENGGEEENGVEKENGGEEEEKNEKDEKEDEESQEEQDGDVRRCEEHVVSPLFVYDVLLRGEVTSASGSSEVCPAADEAVMFDHFELDTLLDTPEQEIGQSMSEDEEEEGRSLALRQTSPSCSSWLSSSSFTSFSFFSSSSPPFSSSEVCPAADEAVMFDHFELDTLLDTPEQEIGQSMSEDDDEEEGRSLALRRTSPSCSSWLSSSSFSSFSFFSSSCPPFSSSEVCPAADEAVMFDHFELDTLLDTPEQEIGQSMSEDEEEEEGRSLALRRTSPSCSSWLSSSSFTSFSFFSSSSPPFSSSEVCPAADEAVMFDHFELDTLLDTPEQEIGQSMSEDKEEEEGRSLALRRTSPSCSSWLSSSSFTSFSFFSSSSPPFSSSEVCPAADEAVMFDHFELDTLLDTPEQEIGQSMSEDEEEEEGRSLALGENEGEEENGVEKENGGEEEEKNEKDEKEDEESQEEQDGDVRRCEEHVVSPLCVYDVLLRGEVTSASGSSEVCPAADEAVMFDHFELDTLLDTPEQEIGQSMSEDEGGRGEGQGRGDGGGDGGCQGRDFLRMAALERTRLARAANSSRERGTGGRHDKRQGKVTVDGRPVLARSGRFQWEFMNRILQRRPRDGGYEVQLADDDAGLEVQLRGRYVWGMRVGGEGMGKQAGGLNAGGDDAEGDGRGGRKIWGVSASDWMGDL
eukprot:jgi/Undpi1/13840/HiC_scaffold_9.g03491.m1